ncbi:MAG: glycosyltransferase [Candidatus Dadabacteria bacterium]|nr:glycosyltransferase [Candidatus Dadabacteria bacterium]
MISSYLPASDFLVMPYSSRVTIRDGTEAGKFTSPLKLFEYMAAGKPIVATGVPSVLEILRPGENSVVTPPDDAEAIIRALDLVLADSELCARISEDARAGAAEYTWEKRVERIIGGACGAFV